MTPTPLPAEGFLGVLATYASAVWAILTGIDVMMVLGAALLVVRLGFESLRLWRYINNEEVADE